MRKKHSYLILCLFAFVLSGCSTTFFGTLLVITFRDIITYVGMALVLAVLTTLFSSENKRTAFWICFLLSLVLTPLAGLIYCLILVTKRNE